MDTSTHGRSTRRVRMPRRWRTRVALAGAVLAVLAVPAAWASHQFVDVPNSNPHHDDISAIFGARITTGTSPGVYSPAQPVLREQMASFLRRGLGRTGSSGTTAGVSLTGTFQSIASESITAGGATGGSGFVVLMGSFTVEDPGGAMTVDHRIEFRLREVQTGFTSNVSYTTLNVWTGATSGRPSDSVMKQWQFVIPTGTTRTYSLDARIAFPAAPVTISALNRLMTVMYFPFGPSGTTSPLGELGEPMTTSGSGAGDSR